MSVILFMLAMGGTSDAVADPIAPAKEGMLQCHAPDDVKKTCRSLASYKAVGGGMYVNDATILIAPTGPVTLETSTTVAVKDGAVCGTITTDQIKGGRLYAAGQMLPPDRAGAILDRIAVAMAPVIGKKICTRYAIGIGGLLTATATIDGVARDDLNQSVRWVRAEDGYRVAS